MKEADSSFIPKDERVPKSRGKFFLSEHCSFIPKDERVPKCHFHYTLPVVIVSMNLINSSGMPV